MNPFVEGFVLQASLILALGAQNLFVLESGLKRQRQFLVALVCSICDAILIAAGVAGAATIFIQIPILKIAFGFLGVAFLLYYGAKKILEAFAPAEDQFTPIASVRGVREIVLLTLGFSLLNPHVYLDTVILIGGYAAKFQELDERLRFGLGATSLSVMWFFGLAFFAAALAPWLKNPRAMKRISFIAGALLVLLAGKLGAQVYHWCW
jgi:L-lysine exporter family protein LysE/ArgO